MASESPNGGQLPLGDPGRLDRIVGGWCVGWSRALGGTAGPQRESTGCWPTGEKGRHCMAKEESTSPDDLNCRASAWRATAQGRARWDRCVPTQGGYAMNHPYPEGGGQGINQPYFGLNHVSPKFITSNIMQSGGGAFKRQTGLDDAMRVGSLW